MKIVGITACPTGIAHTYMAAEKLEKVGASLGHQVKIETQGAKVENVLSQDEINQADVVILGVDKDVDLSRFNGKKVKRVSTSEAIKNTENVIDDALNGVSTFVQQNNSEQSNSGGNRTGVYAHFMNGVNWMLPLVIAGGILIACSFAFGIKAADPNDPSFNPIAQALSVIGGDTAFALMVPALAAGIATSIAGRAGFASGIVAGTLAASGGSGFLGGMIGGLLAGYLTSALVTKVNTPKAIASLYQLIVVPLISVAVTGLAMYYVIGQPISFVLNGLTSWLNGLGSTSGVVFGLLIGVMMAADMGGPINKSISTFSIGLMSAGVNAPIAACMAAGMVPPLGIALATVLFKSKFTKEERTSAQSCWVLGLSYITEGAIPFAVSDPLRVIPSLMAGSATAAAISMGAGVTSLAPHGGIWILPIPNVLNHPLMYVVAIVSGMVVTALCLGFLKKKVVEEEPVTDKEDTNFKAAISND